MCSCLADGPYPPSGTKPEGPLLVLPGEYGPPTKPAVEPRVPLRGDIGLDEETAKLMERLRQEAGSERGVYHVYLSDGRLQRVQYTAAPIKPQPQQLNDNDIQGPEGNSAGTYYVKVPEGRLEALRAQQAIKTNFQVPSSGLRGREQGEAKAKLASIHFMDVEPIPPPIYSLNPKPLSRIIRGSPAPRI